jgi:hypothetical protein
MTRPPQNSVENKHKPNQCEDHSYNGCGVRLQSGCVMRGQEQSAVGDRCRSTRGSAGTSRGCPCTPRTHQNQTPLFRNLLDFRVFRVFTPDTRHPLTVATDHYYAIATTQNTTTATLP